MTALLLLVAALCILVGIATPFGLVSQARQDRAYYEQFRRAGVFAVAFESQHGYPPTDAALGKAAFSLQLTIFTHSPPWLQRYATGAFGQHPVIG